MFSLLRLNDASALTEHGERTLFAFGLRGGLRLERGFVKRFLEGRSASQQGVGAANRERLRTCKLRYARSRSGLRSIPNQEYQKHDGRTGRRPREVSKATTTRPAELLFDLQRFRHQRAKFLQVLLELLVIKNGHGNPPWHTRPRVISLGRTGSAKRRYLR